VARGLSTIGGGDWCFVSTVTFPSSIIMTFSFYPQMLVISATDPMA
jgi:uncharacterized protein with PQ loop repeat